VNSIIKRDWKNNFWRLHSFIYTHLCRVQRKLQSRTWGSHSGDYKEFCLLGYKSSKLQNNGNYNNPRLKLNLNYTKYCLYSKTYRVSWMYNKTHCNIICNKWKIINREKYKKNKEQRKIRRWNIYYLLFVYLCSVMCFLKLIWETIPAKYCKGIDFSRTIQWTAGKRYWYRIW
jgi:hypothetical protein